MNTAVAQIEEHEPFISVTHGCSGYFAVMYWWNPDLGGFWEPWNTGFGRYADKEKAIAEARYWAESEELEYRP